MFKNPSTSADIRGRIKTVEIHLLDDRRAVDPRAGRELGAVEDLGRDEFPGFLEMDVSRAKMRLRGRIAGRMAWHLRHVDQTVGDNADQLQLDRNLVEHIFVFALMLGDEVAHRARQHLGVEHAAGEGNRQGHGLEAAVIFEAAEALDANAIARKSGRAERRAGALLERRELLLHIGTVEPIHTLDVCLGEVVAHVGEQESERRGDARVGRHDDFGYLHLRGDVGRMQRPRATKGEKRELARVEAALGRDLADRLDHVAVGDANDSRCGAHQVQADPVGHALNRCARQLGIETRAAREFVGIERAQDDIGVGVRRLHAAVAVASRPGNGPRALRAAFEHAGIVDPGDRPATGADGYDVDRGQHHRHPELDLEFLGGANLTLVDGGDVGARSAHVEADQVARADEFGEGLRGVGAGRRARHDRARGISAGALRRDDPARGLHDQDFAGITARPHVGGQRVHVAALDRLDEGVDDRGRGALEFKDHRRQVRRDGHVDVGALLAQDACHRLFIARIEEGIQEADRDQFDPALAKGPTDRPRFVIVELRVDAAEIVGALGDGEPVSARHQRRRGVPRDVVHPLARPARAPDLDQVAKALGADQRGLRARSRDYRIRRQGVAVQEQRDAVEGNVGGIDGGDHAPLEVGIGRWDLREVEFARQVRPKPDR